MWMHIEDIMGELFHIESKEFETVALNQVYMFSGRTLMLAHMDFNIFGMTSKMMTSTEKNISRKLNRQQANFAGKIDDIKVYSRSVSE